MAKKVDKRPRLGVAVPEEMHNWLLMFSESLSMNSSEVVRNLLEGLKSGRVSLTRDPETDKATKEAFK